MTTSANPYPHSAFLAAATKRTYTINGANGWHEGYTQREAFEKISLICTEIREWQLEDRPDNQQQALNELADIVIRTMDCCELMRRGSFFLALTLAARRHHAHDNKVLQRDVMYGLVADALQAWRKAPASTTAANPADAGDEVLAAVLPPLGELALYALMLLNHYAAPHGLTHEDIITRVLDKNEKRGYRHGGRRV